ncbi:MAG: alpha/beta hydrolase [Coriobacteriia bacterium]|nr:alpha/beta hydrolase [Coriobacteriia bacterium]
MPKSKKKMTAAEKAAARVPDIPDPAKEAEWAAKVERMKPTKKERRGRFALLIGGLLVLLVLSFTLYTCNYSHETDVAREALVPTEQVAVDNQSGWIAFGDPSAEKGFVLYPGGKVAPEAYAPLMHELADRGVFCVIAKMPFNLAFFGTDAADGVIAAYPQVKTWYVGGHSLGGPVACRWVVKDPNRVAGVVLLATYTTVDLTNTGVRVLEVYGSNDTAMNRDNYVESQPLLPTDTTEVIIQGGNHAQFGEYGEQNGDGAPAISAEEQRKQAADALVDWMNAAS